MQQQFNRSAFYAFPIFFFVRTFAAQSFLSAIFNEFLCLIFLILICIGNLFQFKFPHGVQNNGTDKATKVRNEGVLFFHLCMFLTSANEGV
jgi:hypothetical protein